MKEIELAQKILAWIVRTEQMRERSSEAHWYAIYGVLIEDVKQLCTATLAKQQESERSTLIRWTRADGSEGSFASSDEQEVDERLHGLFLRYINGKLQNLHIEQ
jgi:hypothetical protein